MTTLTNSTIIRSTNSALPSEMPWSDSSALACKHNSFDAPNATSLFLFPLNF